MKTQTINAKARIDKRGHHLHGASVVILRFCGPDIYGVKEAFTSRADDFETVGPEFLFNGWELRLEKKAIDTSPTPATMQKPLSHEFIAAMRPSIDACANELLRVYFYQLLGEIDRLQKIVDDTDREHCKW